MAVDWAHARVVQRAMMSAVEMVASLVLLSVAWKAAMMAVYLAEMKAA